MAELKLLVEEKKLWRQKFLTHLSDALSDPDILAEALLMRESFKKKDHSKFEANEFEAAFKALEAHNVSLYSADFQRSIGALEKIGYSNKEISKIPASLIIKIDAAISYAKAKLCYEFNKENEITGLGELELTYANLDVNQDEIIEDKRTFIDKTLPQAAKPIISSYIPSPSRDYPVFKGIILPLLLMTLGILLMLLPIPFIPIMATQIIGAVLPLVGLALGTIVRESQFGTGHQEARTVATPSSTLSADEASESDNPSSSTLATIKGLGGAGKAESHEDIMEQPDASPSTTLFSPTPGDRSAAEKAPMLSGSAAPQK